MESLESGNETTLHEHNEHLIPVLDMSPGAREDVLRIIGTSVIERLAQAPDGVSLPVLLEEIGIKHRAYQDDVLRALHKLDVRLSGIDTVSIVN